MKFELLHPADQIVMMMQRIYGGGLTTMSGGNLSILDSDGDIWITPSGIDKGNLTRDDIMQVKPDGTIIGRHKPSVELPFHSLVYKTRPDVRAVLHAHPPALVSYSLLRKVPNTTIIPTPYIVCGKVESSAYEVPGSIKLGQNIAKVFKKGINVVMMDNHGVVVCGDTIYEAFKRFETLEYCARLNWPKTAPWCPWASSSPPTTTPPSAPPGGSWWSSSTAATISSCSPAPRATSPAGWARTAS